MATARASSRVEGSHQRVVDLHAHFVPPAVVRAAVDDGERYGVRVRSDGAGQQLLSLSGGPEPRPLFDAICDLEHRIEQMDLAGIDVQVLATWMDLAGYELAPEQAARWSRLQNEAMAEAIEPHPDRLLAMGTLPLQDVDLACAEMRYCVEQLGMAGFILGTNVAGGDLDAAGLDPLWRLAADLGVLLFFHPAIRQIGFERLSRGFLNNLVGNPTETTIAATRLVLAGVPQRFPDLKCMLAHGGGFLPYQIGRVDHGYAARADLRQLCAAAPSAMLSWFYYDSIVFDDAVLSFLLDRVSPDRVVLGTDYPFDMADTGAVARVRRCCPSDVASRRVLGANAAELLQIG